jgi:hypothetical protein
MVALDHDLFAVDRQAIEYFAEAASQLSRGDGLQRQIPRQYAFI